MNASDPSSPLRMSPPESLEERIRRHERGNRAELLRRENALNSEVSPFRVGSVPYLNAVPLTKGLEDQIEFLPPSELGAKLRRDELDAALVSVTEVLFSDRYDVLDGVAVASLGEVKSVFLAHRGPISAATEIFCDRASLTSVSLLRVLLAERDLRPELKPLEGYNLEPMPDYVLLIGNPAIDFLRRPHDHQIWDLGSAWCELTHLPFVYAVWALRRGIENRRLRSVLRQAQRFGLETLDSIIREHPDYDYSFRKDYLGWHIHYHLGSDEKRGLAKFAELLGKHAGRPVFDPRFVV